LYSAAVSTACLKQKHPTRTRSAVSHTLDVGFDTIRLHKQKDLGMS